MNYWLLKSEPSVYSYPDLQRDQRTVWDGVANNLALKYIREVKSGDRAFIYHTGDERQITGIADVVSDPYADPSETDPRLLVFDVVPVRAMVQAVTLSTVKQLPEFADFVLVKNSRLSVMPITAAQWQRLCQLGQTDP